MVSKKSDFYFHISIAIEPFPFTRFECDFCWLGNEEKKIRDSERVGSTQQISRHQRQDTHEQLVISEKEWQHACTLQEMESIHFM